MRLRSKIIASASIVVGIIIAVIAVDYNTNDDKKNSISKGSLQSTKNDEKTLTEEDHHNGNGTVTNERKPSGISSNSGEVTPVDEASETGALAKTESADREKLASTTAEKSSGIHFSSREEAVAFGFSRFTAEEIAIYNRAAKNGLTPEQEEMALQMAYSRFSQAEVAAIKEALGR